ncbi:plasmid transfer protein TraB [Streptantibioticus silvisoli]|uniref:Plasmid transfer protein TraB n=1 Tax=Streptantibioticus silvisoli TaxID=2705255 RepID=A0ABT6W8R8_9ACTN|nr:plasmid transfer protein TraB [Streptantibioticus silvisoli]MDI5967151.1 plasmid transfer protein TraB [Streptantibioticus silvisoli]
MADTTKGDLGKALKHPHARPWLAVAGEIPASLAAHHYWSHSPLAAVGMTVASAALTAATWWGAQGTTPARRVHATASTAAGTGYLTIAALTSPLGFDQLSWLAMGGAVAAASWNVRKAMRVNVDSKANGEIAASETGLLVKSLGKAKAALRSAPEVEPNKVTAPYQLAPGEMTNAEVGRRIEQIASELGVSPNSIRIQPDPDNAARGNLIVVPKDMLVDGTPWPGPSSFGGTILDPVVIGVYEDGAPEQLWFPGDESAGRNATHFLAAGMNGSGKSAGVSLAMVDVLTRRDVIVWAVDPSKGAQTFGPFLPFLDWVELTEAGGNQMIDALSQVITARADALGRAGFKNWTPEAFELTGMPYLVVWIEEAAKFFRNGTEMEGLVMEARSAGISVIISLQRPSATSMPTDVREQLGGAICFGVKGSTTADMALPDDVRDAGARPEAWENRKRGYNYLVAPGVDEERYAVAARTFVPPSDDDVTAVLITAPQVEADPVTARAAGDAYADRTRHDAGPVPAGAPVHHQEVPVTMTKTDQAAAEQRLLETQVGREIDAATGDDEDYGDVPDVDPDRELTRDAAAPVWQFGTAPAEQPEKSPEDAFAEVLAILDERRDADAEFVGPKDFGPFGRGERIGRSRAWVSKVLAQLAEDGVHLADTDQPGVYKLLHPEMAGV